MSDDSQETAPQRRKITLPIRPKGTVEITEVTEVPPVDGILAKAISTIANEINKLYVRSHAANLSDKEARILQGHIKTLIELSREQRERDKADDLSNMSNEELFDLAKQILSKQGITP